MGVQSDMRQFPICVLALTLLILPTQLPGQAVRRVFDVQAPPPPVPFEPAAPVAWQPPLHEGAPLPGESGAFRRLLLPPLIGIGLGALVDAGICIAQHGEGTICPPAFTLIGGGVGLLFTIGRRRRT